MNDFTSTIVSFDNFTAPEYQVPEIVGMVGNVLWSISKEEDDDGEKVIPTLVDLFSSDSDTQRAYVNVLIRWGCFWVIIMMSWYWSLVILKCKGRDVGCASGRAFRVPSPRKARNTIVSATEVEEEDDDADSYLQSTFYTRHNRLYYHDQQRQFNDEDDFPIYEDMDYGDPHQQFQPHHHRRNSHHRHHRQRELPTIIVNHIPRDREMAPSTRCGCASDHVYYVTRRQKRTRLVYLLFAAFSLVCSLFIWVRTYRPLQQSTTNLANVVTDAYGILESVDVTLQTADDAAIMGDALLQEIPLDFEQVCPNIPPQQYGSSLGVDPRDVALLLEKEFDNVLELVQSEMTNSQRILLQGQTTLEKSDQAVEDARTRMWIIPFMLVWAIFLAIISMTAVVLATCMEGRRPPNLRLLKLFEDIFMGWFVIPSTIIWTLIGWGLIIGFSYGTMFTSDVCLTGGGPNATIAAILEAQHFDTSGSTYQWVTTYTGGCQAGDDPVGVKLGLRELLGNHLTLMRSRLDQAELVGYGNIEQLCGEGNQVQLFFAGVRTLESQLLSVQESLEASIEMLSCPRVYDLYTSAVHDSVCTDLASASANGFLLLLCLVSCIMVLLSLRAAWRRSGYAHK